MNYDTRIAEWLEGKDLTLEDGATLLGCSAATLCRWRAGETQPQGMYRVALDKRLRHYEASAK